MRLKKPAKIFLATATILVCIILGFFSTFIFHFPQLKKNINFLLIPGNDSSQNLPAELPQWIHDQNFVLTLISPKQIWWREQQQIRMEIIPGKLGGKSNFPPGKYNLFYEVRLELSSAQLLSGDTIVEPLDPNNPALFLWDFIAQIKKDLNGKIWVYFHITDQATAAHWQFTRLAIPIQIEVTDFLGLSLRSLRILLLSLVGFLTVFTILRKFLPMKVRRKCE